MYPWRCNHIIFLGRSYFQCLERCRATERERHFHNLFMWTSTHVHNHYMLLMSCRGLPWHSIDDRPPSQRMTYLVITLFASENCYKSSNNLITHSNSVILSQKLKKWIINKIVNLFTKYFITSSHQLQLLFEDLQAPWLNIFHTVLNSRNLV